PLIHPFLANDQRVSKEDFIATEALCSGFIHVTKLPIYFSSMGFTWFVSELWFWFLVASTIFGVLIGNNILRRLSLERFQLMIKVILTLLSVRLIYQGIFP
ncbi:MAG: hypothetical protein RMK80_09815, partial [Pseudobdellovibrionaceae bacterium]|nr:hypothetical protein [Pseudobdellovibrionaceae bacterium]